MERMLLDEDRKEIKDNGDEKEGKLEVNGRRKEECGKRGRLKRRRK